MHYALVSDLLTKEEFDERVETKSAELGGAVDELCAAMLVVEELGRSHIRIGEIKDTSTSLVSFFGKILEVTPPREFKREGEEDEPGLVASVVLGDPTGTVKMTMWDAMAAAATELEIGSVVEVIAKPRPGYRSEVTCAAVRPSAVTIVETKCPPRSETMKAPLVAKVLFIGEVRELTRRDGSASTLQEIIVGDPSGTARIITWEPELFADLIEGVGVSFSGLTRKEDEDAVEYVAGTDVVITPCTGDIAVLSVDVGDVAEGQTSIVTGVVISVSATRTFITRRGTESRVKNIRLGSETGVGFVNIAAWNEASSGTVLPGDRLEVLNAQAKLNRYGDVELSVGRGTVMRLREAPGVVMTVSGLVIPRPEGMTLDDGVSAWILVTDQPLSPASRIRVTGVCKNSRIVADTIEEEAANPAELRLLLQHL